MCCRLECYLGETSATWHTFVFDVPRKSKVLAQCSKEMIAQSLNQPGNPKKQLLIVGRFVADKSDHIAVVESAYSWRVKNKTNCLLVIVSSTSE